MGLMEKLAGISEQRTPHGGGSIKAIQTDYNGYRFRSRLEARWAVFFDAGDIKYQYEPEGYETESGRYLPDFYLPNQQVHVEVKGQRDGYQREVLRIRQFIRWGGPIRRVVILSDVPKSTEDGGLWHFPAYYFDGRDDCVKPGWFFFYDCDDGIDGNISFAHYDLPRINTWNMSRNDFSISPESDHGEINPKTYSAEYNNLNYERNKTTFEAWNKARRARFEYGETPSPRTAQVPAPNLVPSPLPKPATLEYPTAPAPQPPAISTDPRYTQPWAPWEPRF